MDLGYDGLSCPVNDGLYHCHPRGKIQGYFSIGIECVVIPYAKKIKAAKRGLESFSAWIYSVQGKERNDGQASRG
jgi:hypothetical protein